MHPVPARLARLAFVVLLPLLVVSVLAPAAQADKRWVFYTEDTTHYTSPWFGGNHRIMVPFGCTSAPYYSPDPRCADDHGFHHGLDIAMPCGTKLFSPYRGRVVAHDGLGPAYGTNPMLIRYAKRGFDVVIGHTRRVYLHPGDRVRAGATIALASDNGAPDGCHLHFEKRAIKGALDTATKPRRLLALTPKE